MIVEVKWLDTEVLCWLVLEPYGQNQFMLRGCWVTRIMDSDIDNDTVECKDSRDRITSSGIHLHFLNKMDETE